MVNMPRQASLSEIEERQKKQERTAEERMKEKVRNGLKARRGFRTADVIADAIPLFLRYAEELEYMKSLERELSNASETMGGGLEWDNERKDETHEMNRTTMKLSDIEGRLRTLPGVEHHKEVAADIRTIIETLPTIYDAEEGMSAAEIKSAKAVAHAGHIGVQAGIVQGAMKELSKHLGLNAVQSRIVLEKMDALARKEWETRKQKK